MAEGARSMDNEHKGHADFQHYNTTNAARQDRSTVPDAKFHAGSRVYYDHPDIPLGKLKAVVKAGPFFLNEKMETSKANEEHVWRIYKIHYHFDGETTLLENYKRTGKLNIVGFVLYKNASSRVDQVLIGQPLRDFVEMPCTMRIASFVLGRNLLSLDCSLEGQSLYMNNNDSNKTAVREFPMTTLPLDTNDEDLMEKGELGVRDVVMTTFLDNKTLQPIRLEGVTQEQFKQSLPSQTTERYLQYLRGVKGRKDAKECIVSTIERRPQGYPQLAAVIDSDEQFMLYRRFGFLQTRLLLNKQEEMRVLERRLYHIDRYYGRNEPARLRSHDICNAIDDDHKNIVVEIEKKYNEYAQLLTHARTLASFDKPRAADYLRLRGYLNRKAPLCGDEQEWILQQDDLITLKPTRDNTWLDMLIELIPQRFPCRLTRYIFCTTELRQKTNPDTTKIFLSDPDRVNAIASVVLLATVLALFVIPVTILWYLFQMSNPGSANIGIILAILLASAFIFSAVISLFTHAKRHEVLAATAAYCAGLVLFVGNVETVRDVPGRSRMVL